MNETDKRILSWGFAKKCPLISQQQASLIDIGRHTHLTFPPQRGIYLQLETPAYPNPQQAIGTKNIFDPIPACRLCSDFRQCQPERVALKAENNQWKPAIRPKKQRP